MRLYGALLIFGILTGVSAPVQADEFGSRFTNESPVAFLDKVRAFEDIEPAGGGEEEGDDALSGAAQNQEGEPEEEKPPEKSSEAFQQGL